MALLGDITEVLRCRRPNVRHDSISPALGLFQEAEWHVKQQVDVHRSGYPFLKHPNGNKWYPATPQSLGKVTDAPIAILLAQGVVRNVARWPDGDE
jgi:hypothetical protein